MSRRRTEINYVLHAPLTPRVRRVQTRTTTTTTKVTTTKKSPRNQALVQTSRTAIAAIMTGISTLMTRGASGMITTKIATVQSTVWSCAKISPKDISGNVVISLEMRLGARESGTRLVGHSSFMPNWRSREESSGGLAAGHLRLRLSRSNPETCVYHLRSETE